MLSEMRFENGHDGGDVQILFDKASLTAPKRKPFCSLQKALLLTASVALIVLVLVNHFTGWWGRAVPSSQPEPSPSPAALGGDAMLVYLEEFKLGVKWELELASASILFTLTSKDKQFAEASRWLLLGFSDRDPTSGTDFCLFHNGNVTDGFLGPKLELRTDRQQDWELVSHDEAQIVLRRHHLTCDPRDFPFQDATTQLLFASGTSAPAFPKDVAVHPVRLFRRPAAAVPKETDLQAFEVLAKNASVVSATTTHWCVVTRLDEVLRTQKHHLVMAQPELHEEGEAFVTQMELRVCEHAGDDSIEFNGRCDAKERPKDSLNCTRSLLVWSMGSGSFVLPDAAGLPWGGEGSASWVLLHVHYANPTSKSVVDNSGLRLFSTATLRPNDAALLETGVTPTAPGSSVPPKQRSFSLSGFCSSECTDTLPTDGIHVFASRLALGGHGTSIATTLVRAGERLRDVNRDGRISHHGEHIDALEPEVVVRAGDVLLTTCSFDTEAIAEVTLGEAGELTCTNTLYYYPAVPLKRCSSSLDTATLNQWLTTRGAIEEGTPVQKLDKLKWDVETVADWKELSATAPLTIQCQKATGESLLETVTGVPRPSLRGSSFFKLRRLTHECPAAND